MWKASARERCRVCQLLNRRLPRAGLLPHRRKKHQLLLDALTAEAPSASGAALPLAASPTEDSQVGAGRPTAATGRRLQALCVRLRRRVCLEKRSWR